MYYLPTPSLWVLQFTFTSEHFPGVCCAWNCFFCEHWPRIKFHSIRFHSVRKHEYTFRSCLSNRPANLFVETVVQCTRVNWRVSLVDRCEVSFCGVLLTSMFFFFSVYSEYCAFVYVLVTVCCESVRNQRTASKRPRYQQFTSLLVFPEILSTIFQFH